MQIVLLKKIKTLGNAGEIKDVKRGYAINFLIPEGLAMPATAGFIKEAGIRARKTASAEKVDESEMDELIKELDSMELVFKQKASEKGSLFGSIKAGDIAEEIAKKTGKAIDEDYIMLKEPIKKIGEYEVEVKAGEAKGKIKVKVEAEG